jgi:hypothetical protein
MGRTLNQVMSDLPVARLAKVKARVVAIIAQRMSLKVIRKPISKIQVRGKID